MNQLTEILKSINRKINDHNFINDHNEDAYPSFVVNRIYSNFPDTIFHAQNMNRYPRLNKKYQYKYLYYTITAKQRFSPIIKEKVVDDEVLNDLGQKYKISRKSLLKNYSVLLNIIEKNKKENSV
ncbi:MAG: DNA polymerase clamp loader subunit A [Patescibacteria group bacterium]|nr:DNA polymerase clamp loader subunit A [Patescibacteria group bacterium]